MCDPITLAVMAAGTAMSVGGGIVSGREGVENNRRIAEARNRVLRETQARNKVASDASRAEFTKRLADMDPSKTAPQLTENQGARTETIQGNLDTAAAPDLPAEVAAPKIVQTALGQRLAQAAEKGQARAASLGKLGGYGDYFQGEAIRDEEAGRGVDTQSNFIRGNMGLMGSLQDLAEIEAYRPSSGLGEILSTLGSVAGMAAGSGAFKGAPGAGGGQGFHLPNMKYKGANGMLGGGV